MKKIHWSQGRDLGSVSGKSRSSLELFRVSQFAMSGSSVSQERRGFESSNVSLILLFVIVKTCLKNSFPTKQEDGSFANGFSGPRSFRDFGETGPCHGGKCD